MSAVKEFVGSSAAQLPCASWALAMPQIREVRFERARITSFDLITKSWCWSASSTGTKVTYRCNRGVFSAIVVEGLASPSIVVLPNRRRLPYLGICHIGPIPSINIESTDNPDVALANSPP
jgi:hypothetical protein